MIQPNGQDVSDQIPANKPEVQAPGPASLTVSLFLLYKRNQVTYLTGTTAPSDEPDLDIEHFGFHASPTHVDKDREVSDLESVCPDREELLDVVMWTKKSEIRRHSER